MGNGILMSKILYGFIVSMFAIFIIIMMVQGKKVIGGKIITFKHNFLKFIYTKLVPGILVLGIIHVFVYPLMDYFDPNKYQYSDIGILEAVATHNSSRDSGRNEYTVKINGHTYRLSESLISYDNLKKGDTYEIYYFKHSRIVYYITHIKVLQ